MNTRPPALLDTSYDSSYVLMMSFGLLLPLLQISSHQATPAAFVDRSLLPLFMAALLCG